MIGMLAAFGAEANTRAPILKQIQTSPVFVASAFAIIILASGGHCSGTSRASHANCTAAVSMQKPLYRQHLACQSAARVLALLENPALGPGVLTFLLLGVVQ
jgi:hypothetical protein